MSDIVEAFGGPVVDPDSKIEFPLLETPDIGVLAARAKAERFAAAKKLASDCMLSGTDKFHALRAAEKEPYTIWDFQAYANTPDGADAVLIASLVKASKTSDEAKTALRPIPPFSRIGIALKVIQA